MNTLPVEIAPRADLTPDEFRRLGRLLQEWQSREAGPDGCQPRIEEEGLQSLLAGEPPSSAACLMLNAMEKLQGPLSAEIRKRYLQNVFNPGGLPPHMAAEFERLAHRRSVIVSCNPDRKRRDVALSLDRAGIAPLCESVHVGPFTLEELIAD